MCAVYQPNKSPRKQNYVFLFRRRTRFNPYSLRTPAPLLRKIFLYLTIKRNCVSFTVTVPASCLCILSKHPWLTRNSLFLVYWKFFEILFLYYSQSITGCILYSFTHWYLQSNKHVHVFDYGRKMEYSHRHWGKW